MKIDKTIILKNNKKIHIRNAIKDDAKSIVNFMCEMGNETDYLNFGAGEYNISINQMAMLISTVYKRNNSLGLLVTMDNKLIGVSEVKGGSLPRTVHVCEFSVMVKKDYCDMGIATHLLKNIFTWAFISGINKITLKVRTDNEKAIRLYEKFGFSTNGTIYKANLINDSYYDQYYMEVWLPDFKDRFFKNIINNEQTL